MKNIDIKEIDAKENENQSAEENLDKLEKDTVKADRTDAKRDSGAQENIQSEETGEGEKESEGEGETGEEKSSKKDEIGSKKERGAGAIANSLHTKNVRFGSYSTALIVIVIAIAVAVNLVIGQIPVKFTQFDLSPGKLYTIGEKTEKLLKSLDEDVTLTVLAEESTADETLDKLLERYEDASKHVNIKYVDPAVSIGTAQTYSGATQNSVVVSCGTRETVVDYSNIYVSDYSSYYTTGAYSTSFDGEGQLTSAIANVTSDDLPMIYSVTGHGESSAGSSLTSLMTKQNVSLNELNLMTSGGIPEDCDCLLINAPMMDYSEEEASQIISWLDAGGKALITVGYTEESMTNFSKILEAYGMKFADGIVMESSNHYYQYPLYVIPEIEDTEVTSDLVSEKANILIPQALGILETEKENVTLTKLLSSSDEAYTKQVVDGKIATYEKESGDIDGPFAFAYLAEKDALTASENDGDESDADIAVEEDEEDSSEDEDIDNGAGEDIDADAASAGGKVILVSASSLTDESITGVLPVSNLDFYMNCIGNLCESSGDAGNISIDMKSLTPEYITVPAFQTGIWLILTVVILPLGILITGFIVWFRRRKK